MEATTPSASPARGGSTTSASNSPSSGSSRAASPPIMSMSAPGALGVAAQIAHGAARRLHGHHLGPGPGERQREGAGAGVEVGHVVAGLHFQTREHQLDELLGLSRVHLGEGGRAQKEATFRHFLLPAALARDGLHLLHLARAPGSAMTRTTEVFFSALARVLAAAARGKGPGSSTGRSPHHGCAGCRAPPRGTGPGRCRRRGSVARP